MNLKNRRIWYDEKLDYVCIEIFLPNKIAMLKIDEKMNKDFDMNDFKNKIINIYKLKNKIYECPGIINYSTEDYKLFYSCETNSGDSVSPIITIEDNSIIGIHLGKDKRNNNHCGIYLKRIFDHMKTIKKKLDDSRLFDDSPPQKTNLEENYNDFDYKSIKKKYFIRKILFLLMDMGFFNIF